jgi:general secretion pathway protein G
MPPLHLIAERQIGSFGIALDSFKQDAGRYPSTEEGLQALRVKPESVEKWDGPYLIKDIPNDPWNHPYIYRFPGKAPGKPEIISYGADGKPGGTGKNADVVSE